VTVTCLACYRHAHQLSLMRAVACPAARYGVSLGDHVVHVEMEIGERIAVYRYRLLETLSSAKLGTSR
jgi:hypothetical protein